MSPSVRGAELEHPKPGADPDSGSDGFVWQVFLIAAASSYAPFQVYVNNKESPSLVTAVVLSILITLFGVAIRWLLTRTGLDPLGSSYAVAAFIVLVMNSGAMVDNIPGGRWAAVGLCLVAAILIYRLRDLQILKWVIAFGAFALVITPVVEKIAATDAGELGLNVQSLDSLPVATETPDVVVLVADGYPARTVLEGLYGIDNSGFYDQLGSSGFEISHDAVANYPFTVLSVPNTMALDYVAGEQHLSRADFDALFDMLSGSNSLSGWLRRSGYQQTYVESGWLGTSCTKDVDQCVTAPWPDESLYDNAARSLLRGAGGFEEGRSFARGTLHSIDWLDRNMESYLTNNTPDYLYVHLLAPHAPLFLDADCHLKATAATAGFTLGTPSTDENDEIRKAAFGQQLLCVNAALLRATEKVAQHDGVMLLFGDHGTDLGGQLYIDGRDWDVGQRWERFHPLVAGFGRGCDFGDVGSLVNLGRRLVSCLSRSEFPDLPDRSYVATKEWDLIAVPVPPTMDG